jgi:cytochrome c peroxidase
MTSSPLQSATRIVAGALALLASGAAVQARQVADPVDWIPSLKSVAVPRPTAIDAFIVDHDAAVALGKAFFWDARLGSDGTACATCHHRAGADSRSRNTFHPGFDGFFEESIAPGAQAPASVFPTTAYADPASRFSARIRNVDDIAGSGGTKRELFGGLSPDGGELCVEAPMAPFLTASGDGVEQVTGRNSPAVVNAVFYTRQFWDGRANHWFNGVNPFGPVDTEARVWRLDPGATAPVQTQVLLDSSSLASQAVGPVNNPVEMAAHGRGWVDVARKLLDTRPLLGQQVAATDSVLGALAAPDGIGLSTTYRALIEQAFAPAWRSELPVDADGTPQLEANMALLFGLAVQAYESTLVSDDSRYDRWMDAAGPLAGPAGHFDALEWRGLELFFNANPALPQTNCLDCHRTPLFSVATFLADAGGGNAEDGPGPQPLGVANERMPSMATAIEATALFVENPGAPGVDPAAVLLDFELSQADVEFGPRKGAALVEFRMPDLDTPFCGTNLHVDRNPLGPDGGRFRFDLAIDGTCARSLLVRARGFQEGVYELRVDGVVRATFLMPGDDLYDAGFYNIGVRPTIEDLGVAGTHPNGVPLGVSDRLAAGLDIPEYDAPATGYLGEAVRTRGAFKTPTLRNVELTAPYFHNGGVLTLEDTIRFYNRGGDFHDENIDDLHPDMEPMNLSEDDILALAAFMRTLTDERVRDERPPFDHPSLGLANGAALPATGLLGRDEPCILPMTDFEASLLVPESGVDCDANGRLDSCEIEQDPKLDADLDGRLDRCRPPCPADLDASGLVDGGDLAAILANWQSADPASAALDLDGSGFVDGGDLAMILAGWGACPE